MTDLDAMCAQARQLDLVIEINNLLKDAPSTWRLFTQLDAHQPDLARHFASRAMPLLPKPRTAPRLAVELHNLTAHVRYSAAVLRGTGRADQADAARGALLAGLEACDLRAAAQLQLDDPGVIFRLVAAHQVQLEQQEGQCQRPGVVAPDSATGNALPDQNA